jgi:hypothetical protein
MTLLFVWLAICIVALAAAFITGDILEDDTFYYLKSPIICARCIFWPLFITFLLIRIFVLLIKKIIRLQDK